MPKSILFWPDVYKEQGHWLPTLKWAQDLHDSEGDDYTVSYMGISDCKSVIDSYDNGSGHFLFQTILSNMYPKGYTTKSASDPNERWKTWHVWAILYSRYFALNNPDGEIVDENIVFNLPENARIPNDDLVEDAKSIWKALQIAKPDLLVGGYFTSLECLLIHWIYNIPVVISTTYLRHPQDDPAIRARVNLLSFSKPELHKIVNMAVNGSVSTDAPDMTLQEFTQPLETCHELIPCPREYEYDHYRHGDLVHYVDPCITKELTHDTDSLDSEGNVINWNSILENENIIFVTAGSQVLDYEDKAKNLFHSMCKAMQSPQLQDCFLIIAAGSKLVNSPEWKNYDKSKIIIASWVPQRELLAKENVKCAIIHGGLATIKECVYFDRNFVINPLGKDQIDNALRLRHLGIDNIISMANVNPNSLLDAINRVTSDYRMKSKLKKLSDIFVAAENEKKGLSVILDVLSRV
jgi:UDP-N-acetylglucosamine:LPS N-acetylglucosamine transferase